MKERERYASQPEHKKQNEREKYASQPEHKKQNEREKYASQPEQKKDIQRERYASNPLHKRIANKVSYSKHLRSRLSKFHNRYQKCKSQVLLQRRCAYYNSAKAAKLLQRAKNNKHSKPNAKKPCEWYTAIRCMSLIS